MEKEQTMQEIQEMVQEANQNQSDRPVEQPISYRKMALKRKKQELAYKKYFTSLLKKQKRINRIINNQLEIYKRAIGKEDFKMLKDICMVNTPEQKNDKGEVTQAASSYLNKAALLHEAKYVMVLQRQARIDKGLRKKTTGRSSKRKSHKQTFNFINLRNKNLSTATE